MLKSHHLEVPRYYGGETIVESVPYCRLIDRERRSETVQTPIGLLTLSASGKRMTARIVLSENLQGLDDVTQKKRVGKLLQECPDYIMERVRIMFTDCQLIGMELARRAEHFAHLSAETDRVYRKEGASERFSELAEAHLRALGSLSGDIPVLDDNPLSYTFFEMLILQAFDPIKPDHALKT